MRSRRLRDHLPTNEDFRRVRHRWNRVLVLSAVTGALVGLAVAAFEEIVGKRMLRWTLDLPPGVQIVVPALGLVMAWLALRYVGHGATSATADEYLDAYHHRDGDIPLREAPGKILASAFTLGAGGAMGFEGPSIYMGATIGSALRRRFPKYFEPSDRRLLVVAGAAAGVSAIFRAPATGAVYAVEVPYLEDTASHAVVPAIVAAATSYLTFVIFFGTARLFSITGHPDLNARDLGGALAMGVLAGLGALAFSRMLLASKHIAEVVTPWKRLLGTGIALTAVAGITYLVYDAPLSLGPGYNAINWTRAERSLGLILLLFVIRAVATSLTVSAGGVGGVFIPLVVQGWILGTAVEVVVSSHTLLFPVIGAAAFLGAGYRTPIAAVVFVAEATGRPGFVVPALLATGVAQLIMGSRSVSAYQLLRRRDRVEQVDRRPVLDAMVAIPTEPRTARVADVFGGDPVAAVAVVDDGTFLGVVDAARASAALAAGRLDATLGDVMVTEVELADPTWTIADARTTLAATGARALPVVDGSAVLGAVTAESILALTATRGGVSPTAGDDEPERHRDD